MTALDIAVIAVLGPGVAIWGYAFFAAIYMTRALRVLGHQPRPEARYDVSIISPACNEASTVSGSVKTWLAQDDVDMHIVVVNDRSIDDTGAIIDALAQEHDQVTAVHVDTLPEGWLGKLNALHRGVAQARGDWLLFADADVRLTPGALARAIHYAEREGFDLVTAYPQIETAGWLCDLAWAAISSITGASGFWRSRDPKSERAFAMGAFILVRRSAFEATPGFAWLKLEVADDMGLAILLKHHGFRCDVLCGREQVRLTWYTSLSDMVVRSQKNWYGIACRFSLARAWLFALVLVATTLTPLAILLPLTHPIAIALPLAVPILIVGASIVEAVWSGRRVAPALMAPLGFPLVAYMVLRAAIIGHRLGGITWRGVTYPASQLRDVQRFRM